MKQGTKEWLAHRRNYIGASDAPIIMGVSPWRTPYQLWQEKLGLGGEQPETRAMTYGKDMEEVARRKYEEYTGNLLSTDENDTLVYHPQKPFMMASLDGITFNKDMAVEIKNVCFEDHSMAKSGKIPEKYYPQVQHQLACLGFNMLHYFSYREGDFALVEVERDQSYIDSLYQSEGAFWDLVLNLEAPALTDKDYVVMEDQEWDHLAKEWANISERISILEKQEKEYRAALIAKAGGQNAKGSGICLTKILRKGTVDYKRVPELIGVDLEKYRKDPSESWRLIAK